jgi:hypothetical protein
MFRPATVADREALDARTREILTEAAQTNLNDPPLPRIDSLEGFAAFLIEGCRTTTPLEPLVGTMLDDTRAIAPGTVVTVQATIETNGRAILVGAPVLVGRNGEASSALVAPHFADAG